MYSKNTEIEIEYLREADTLLQVRDISEKIISHNKNVALAYDAQALIARNSGKYEQMISYKKEAVRAAKYNINEYYDYFRLLKSVLDSGNSKINPKQREVCIQALLEIPELMKSVENNSDPLAWRINDKPNLVPTEEMTEYIKKIKR